MAHRIVWSRCAAQDLDSITDYIAADSPAYAGVVLKNIVNQTRILARFPRAGRKVPEFDDENIRELIAYSYRIIYRLQDEEVLIVAVIHGKRVLQ
ncbi:MAG TPA: type II toxin-antitoxin system RelE/ParE family toxin [Terriglobales bacterium]|nr:type II toxin-antitoxin system RelE/ParE family toxin [Terriglobales bacterium]